MQKRQPNFNIVPLCGEDVAPQVIKVGILPFVCVESASGGQLKVMAMRPCAEKEVLGSPKFQIAKGTRQINISGSWCDMREDDLRYADESFHEPLVDTALREGHEEIGLKSDNIKTLFDMGGFTFTSASRGIKKPMHLFAAEIIDTQNFGAFESTTSETDWFTLEEFTGQGLADHILIITEALGRLSTHIFRR